MKKYVDVILPLPLPKSFTYSLPDECAEDVKIGCRVVVPFGRKKFYTAIVLNVHYCAPTEYEVKDISALLDASPILLPVQFKFWEWIADYYLCTQGDVYKAALPSGLKLESETIVEYNPDFEADAPLPEPHAATEISVAAASTAAAIRLMPFGFLKIAMVMVVFPLLLVLKKYDYSVTGLLASTSALACATMSGLWMAKACSARCTSRVRNSCSLHS